MKRLIAISGGFLLLCFLYRPVVHYFCLPRVVHAPWIEPLATARTGFSHRAEILTVGTDIRNFPEFKSVFAASEQKRRLYSAYITRTGKVGLSRRYSTVEGNPIFTWLIAQDGALTFIHDSSYDGGASPADVYSYIPKTIRLGFMHDNKFIEGEPSPTDSPVVVFELDIGRHDKEYFY